MIVISTGVPVGPCPAAGSVSAAALPPPQIPAAAGVPGDIGREAGHV